MVNSEDRIVSYLKYFQYHAILRSIKSKITWHSTYRYMCRLQKQPDIQSILLEPVLTLVTAVHFVISLVLNGALKTITMMLPKPLNLHPFTLLAQYGGAD